MEAVNVKKQLEDDLVVALMPYIEQDRVQDAKLAIAMAVSQYDIAKAETALVPYDGDINEVILKRFLAAKMAQGLSARTITYYRDSITMSLQIIGKPYMDVTADDIRLYLAKRIHVNRVSKTTANNERRNLSAFYGWLQKEEILVRNPMQKVDAVKENKKPKMAFTQMDLEKLRSSCRSPRESAIVEMLISTWCRVSELVQIRIDDIMGDKLIVHGKGGKDREVYMTPKAVLTVNAYLKTRKDNNPYLFPRARCAGDMKAFAAGVRRRQENLWYENPKLVDSARHMGADSVEQLIQKIGKRAGVTNAHPHRFRRTGATMALRNGMPIIQVSKMLGHENIGTTQIYLDISPEELEQAHKRYVL